MGKFGELPTKLKVTLILTWISVIFAIALICSGAKAWLYEFPEGAATTTETASAKTHKNTTLRWGVGPAIIVILSAALGTVGVLRRSRPLVGVFTVSTILCVALSLSGFAVPTHEGSWRSFSDSCACVEEKCCDLGDQCTGEWHKKAAACADGGRGAAYNCPAGQYRASLNTQCAKCSYGTYKAGTADGCCIACPATQTTAKKGAESLSDCSTCATKCAAGKHSASGTCEACPENFYKSCAAGVSECTGCCTVCPAGTVSIPDRSGCAPPNSCPRGEYQPVSLAGNLIKGSCRSTNSCAPCPAGKFGALINSFGFCQVCPKGKYQLTPASRECDKCPKGQYSDSRISNKACKGCTRGRYQDKVGKDSCKTCSSGKTGPVLSDSSSKCVAVSSRRERLLRAAAAAAGDAAVDAALLATAQARLLSASLAAASPRPPSPRPPSRLMSGGPRQWHARALAATNAMNGTVGKLVNNCNADPSSINCCYNTAHTTFCDGFLTALNTVIYLNLVNAILLLLLFVIAINSCRERNLYKTQLGPQKKEGEEGADGEGGESEAAPAAAEASPAPEPSKAVTKSGKKSGKKAKVVL